MLRSVSYNLFGRLAIASFPVVAPAVTYWVYDQATMLKVAQSFNLSSYIAVIGLSGMVLPARDFRADLAFPARIVAHMRAYALLTSLQIVLSLVALGGILWAAASASLPAAGTVDAVWLFVGIGIVQVAAIGSAVPGGFFVAHDRHALPNVAAGFCRGIALAILVLCGLSDLPLAVVSCLWIGAFFLSTAYMWRAALRSMPLPAAGAAAVPATVGVREILGRSSIYLLWAVLAMSFLSIPLTFIAARWPAEFGGMNYAFLVGNSAAAIVTAAMVPQSNLIQDAVGRDGLLSSLLRSSWKLAAIVTVVSLIGFALTWPLHPVLVGAENVPAFRTGAPIVFLTTSVRLATWACTQCAIAIKSESLVMLGPIAEAFLALVLAWALSAEFGVVGVPAGLFFAATGRIIFMLLFEVPRLRAAWSTYGKG